MALPPSRTLRTLIALHWLTVLLFVAAYATMELREFLPKGSTQREAMKDWHYTVGLSIFVVAWLRLFLRSLLAPRPNGLLEPRLQTIARRIVHVALYVLMIALPLLGWLILSASGEPASFFGFDLPALIGANDRLADQFEEIHEVIARIGYGLIGAHALAALVHHYMHREIFRRTILIDEIAHPHFE